MTIKTFSYLNEVSPFIFWILFFILSYLYFKAYNRQEKRSGYRSFETRSIRSIINWKNFYLCCQVLFFTFVFHSLVVSSFWQFGLKKPRLKYEDDDYCFFLNAITVDPNWKNIIVIGQGCGSENSQHTNIYSPDTLLFIGEISTEERITSLGFTPDNRNIAFGSNEKYVIVKSFETGDTIKKFISHEGEITNVEYALDGKYLVTAGDDLKIKFWSTDNYENIFTLDSFIGQQNQMCISKNGKYLLYVTSDNRLILFSVENFSNVRTFSFPHKKLSYPQMSSNAEIIASLLNAKEIMVWDVNTGDIIHHLKLSTKVESFAIDPFGKNLAINYSFMAFPVTNNLLVLWSLETGKLIGKFESHTWDYERLFFSPDSKNLLAAGGT